MKLKKPIFLGSLLAFASPIAIVIACGDKTGNSDDTNKETEKDSKNQEGTNKEEDTNNGSDNNVKSASQKAQEDLEKKVQALNDNSFTGLVDSEKLPSEVTKSEVKSLVSTLTVKDNDIELAAKDADGTLTITIKNYGQDKIINLSGFETILKRENKVLDIIKARTDDLYKEISVQLKNALVDGSKLASDVNKNEVYEELIKIKGLENLTSNQVRLKPIDVSGMLFIYIDKRTPAKPTPTITLDNFKTT